MNRKPHPTDDSWEHDAVWNLLDQAPPAAAGARFAERTVRAARLTGQPAPWWKTVLRPLPLASMAAACAAVAIALVPMAHRDAGASGGVAAHSGTDSHAAEIAEIAETEALIAAVENIDDFSDTELVSLIGF